MSSKLTVRDLLTIDDDRANKIGNLSVQLSNTIDMVEEAQFGKGPSKLVYYKIFKYMVTSRPDRSSAIKNKLKSQVPKHYTVFVMVSPAFSEESFLDSGVSIFCECPDFMYRAAYELSSNSSVFLNKTTTLHLGKAIKVAPTKVTTTPICKHIYAVALKFKEKIVSYGLIKTNKKISDNDLLINRNTLIKNKANVLLPFLTYNKMR